MGAGLHIRVPHSSVPPPPAHAGSPDPEPRGPAGSPTPTGPGRGRDLLAQLVSGLRGPAWRDREVARLEREGWRVSGGDERYGSVWMVKEVKCD